MNATLSIASALQKQAADYDFVVVDFHSIERTADLETSLSQIDDVVVVAEAEFTPTKALQDLVNLVPRDKIAAVIVNKIRMSAVAPSLFWLLLGSIFAFTSAVGLIFWMKHLGSGGLKLGSIIYGVLARSAQDRVGLADEKQPAGKQP